jgi:hypothetical protein
LGEEGAGRRWLFTITYAGGDGARLQRRVEAISHEPADGPALFPRRRDPLVLLALLRLLLSGGHASWYELSYDRRDVLSLLGWGDSREEASEIDEAVERYSLITFRWGMSRAELARSNLSSYTAKEGVISEYRTIDEGEQEGQMRRVVNWAVFSSQFIEGLKRRTLFEINWNRVTSVSYAPKY